MSDKTTSRSSNGATDTYRMFVAIGDKLKMKVIKYSIVETDVTCRKKLTRLDLSTKELK
jgi:hypothetical protein